MKEYQFKKNKSVAVQKGWISSIAAKTDFRDKSEQIVKLKKGSKITKD